MAESTRCISKSALGSRIIQPCRGASRLAEGFDQAFPPNHARIEHGSREPLIQPVREFVRSLHEYAAYAKRGNASRTKVHRVGCASLHGRNCRDTGGAPIHRGFNGRHNSGVERRCAGFYRAVVNQLYFDLRVCNQLSKLGLHCSACGAGEDAAVYIRDCPLRQRIGSMPAVELRRDAMPWTGAMWDSVRQMP